MKKWINRIYMVLIYAFLFAPIFVLIAFSFNESKSRSNFTGFTFKWYKQLFSNDLIMQSLWNTLLVAVVSSVCATLLGTVAAIGIYNLGKRSRSLMMNIADLPVINPEIVTGVSMMILFVFIANLFGIELGFWSVCCAHITFCVPYVIMSVLPKLRQMDISVYEAAQDLGCTPNQAFFKAVMPQIMPGIFSGCLISFTYSIDDFVITYFTSGSSFPTLPTTIYSMTRMKANPQINALSAIIFVAVLVILLISNFCTGRSRKKDEI